MNREEILKYTDRSDIKLSQVMKKIDNNTCGILFLVEDDILVGCITDGDIRRYLLNGGKLEDLAMNAANKTPKCAKTLEEAKSIYHKKDFVMIPIIDDESHILDLYDGGRTPVKNYNPINLPIVINAGGKGTRLEPLTKVLPKPLIPIDDLPIIELIMQEYQNYDCNDFHIIVNYKKELIKAYFSENENKYNISWYDEVEPLGTGGGLYLLKGKLNSTFFFANCDALLTSDYEKILRFHKENKNVITMICAYKNLVIPYGIIEMGKNGIIEEMKEKPMYSFLTNTGIYIVEPEVLDDIEDNVSISFPEIIEKERKLGKRVAAYPVSENEWMDMGQFSGLEKLRNKIINK